MTQRCCKTCAFRAPATDPKAAQSYVRCVAPVVLPPLPSIVDAYHLRQALKRATSEPGNWTTIAHVEGTMKGNPGVFAGVNCPLWEVIL